MARTEVSGVEIEYQLIGDGHHTVVLMPGGRMSKDAPGMREFADALVVGGKRVLLWDRPNCGASDMCFTGESESAMQAQVLVELVRQLQLGPVAVGGGSAGARTAMLAAARDPAAISHLLLWWISGRVLSQLSLGANYCSEPAVAASMGGMDAVAILPSLAEQMVRNPRNLEILRGQDVAQFIAVMERWADAFVPGPDKLLPGMSREAVGRLVAQAKLILTIETAENSVPADFRR